MPKIDRGSLFEYICNLNTHWSDYINVATLAAITQFFLHSGQNAVEVLNFELRKNLNTLLIVAVTTIGNWSGDAVQA